MSNQINNISSIVSEQFPDFYRTDGEDFIIFLQGYYKWLEQNGNFVSEGFKLPEYLDIDDTIDKYLANFKQEYMVGLPDEILGNQKFLQKHILDLYSSKGSPDAIRILFRLLFNEDIKIYLPAKDIFKLSDGKWVSRRYIVITSNKNNPSFQGKEIYGSVSGARAYVTNYETRVVDQRIVQMLYVENIRGNFVVSEPILHEDVTILDTPTIIGAPVAIDIITSAPNFTVGDILVDRDYLYRELKVRVKETNPIGYGIITPKLLSGGSGFSEDAKVTITYGSTTTGTGFNFEIDDITFSTPRTFISDTIYPYLSTPLDTADFGFLVPGGINVPLGSAFSFTTKDYGTIGSIRILNPGVGYNGTVNIDIFEEQITRLEEIFDGGTDWGHNASITGNADYGTDLVKTVDIVNSGIGYYTENEIINFITEEDYLLTAIGRVRLGAVGIEEGSYRDVTGFLDSINYLQDSYYYQDFSYEIQTSKDISKWASVVKRIAHPAGNEMFAKKAIIKTI